MMEREGEEHRTASSMRDTIILYRHAGVWHRAAGARGHTPSIARPSSTTFRRSISFRVEREKRESERKKIEAEGIREFQQIVSQGISDSYLRWRGIEATLQLRNPRIRRS